MVMRNREIGIDRALFVEIGTVAGGVIDAKTDNHASEFELVGDVSNLKEPLSQREIREINAGGLILYKPATRRVGTLEFTLQSYQSELVAAIGQLEAGGSVANPRRSDSGADRKHYSKVRGSRVLGIQRRQGARNLPRRAGNPVALGPAKRADRRSKNLQRRRSPDAPLQHAVPKRGNGTACDSGRRRGKQETRRLLRRLQHRAGLGARI